MKIVDRPLWAADSGSNPQGGTSPKGDKKNTGPVEKTTKPANALQSKSVTQPKKQTLEEELVNETQRLVRLKDERSVRDISTQITRLLLAGANPNSVDKLNSHTAFGFVLESLENASETQNTLRLKLRIVAEMLESGASVTGELAKSSKGKNLAHILAYHSDKQEKRNTQNPQIEGRYLHELVQDTIKKLGVLKPSERKEAEAEAFIKVRERYEKQLFMNRRILETLSQRKSKSLSSLLVETDANGYTPLHYAAEKSNTRRFVSELIKAINLHTADPGKVRNAQTPSGYTAADLAYEAKNGNGNYGAMIVLRATTGGKKPAVNLNIYNNDEVALFLQAGWPEYYQETYPGHAEQEAKEKANKKLS